VYAWELEETDTRLRGLRHEEREDTGLAAVTFAAALVLSWLFPALALPLLVGALAVALLALRAFWRHWELVDRLLLERDAYRIREVRERAQRSSTIENRHSLARSIRSVLKEPGYASSAVRAAAGELQALARDLDDPGLALDPACAVACERLLTDGGTSPLLNVALPADDTWARVRQIRAGFEELHSFSAGAETT
jgi:hypothetical protein